VEAPVIPAWVLDEVKSRWGTNLFFSWEPYPTPRGYVMPVDSGIKLQRRTENGFVEYRYYGTPRDDAFDWYRPDPGEDPTHRYVARDRHHWPDEAKIPGAKIFDCVQLSGALVPPSQAWIDGLSDRYDKWDEFMTEGEKWISAHEELDEKGNPTGNVLNGDQLLRRRAGEDAMADPLTAARRQLIGYSQVGAGGNGKGSLIARPTDLEVGIVNAPADVAAELHGPSAVKL